MEIEKEKTPVVKPTIAGFKGKNPCDWIIVAIDDTDIRATNNSTNEKFEGSLKDFKYRMKV